MDDHRVLEHLDEGARMQPQSDRSAPRAPALDLVAAGGWQVGLFVGIITVALGIILLAWPGETLTVVSILVGIQLLLFGLFRLLGFFRLPGCSHFQYHFLLQLP